jgi:hypothetical protein
VKVQEQLADLIREKKQLLTALNVDSRSPRNPG